MSNFHKFIVVIVATSLAVVASHTWAQSTRSRNFPSQTIQIFVPLTKGSGADIAARILAKEMSTALNQSVVVENRPGAGGQVGGQTVLSAAPDGHTLLVHSASYAVNAVMFRRLPYDPMKDFVDIALIGKTPYVMVTAPRGAYPTVRALIDAARARPGIVAFASAGVGSSTHLTAELFNQRAGLKMLHIPYKGTPEAIADTGSGATAYYMAPLNTAIGLVREGHLRALGLTTVRRSGLMPDVAPLAEQGLPGLDASLWFGMWARGGTPAEIVTRLNSVVNASLQRPALRKEFDTLGIAVDPMTPAEFSRFVRAEIEDYRKVVEQAGVPRQ